MWRACLPVLGNRAPSIIALDTLVNYRSFFSSADFGGQREQFVSDLLRRYNRHIIETDGNAAILVLIEANPSG
jgi:hypothetical protein